jgi:crossover junction endodeoxyribonuclease RuvC
VAAAPNNRISLVDYGCIKTGPSLSLPERLKTIHLTLQDIIQKYVPQVMAVEELFFSKEARTVAAVGQSRGAILLAAALRGLPICEYNPRHVKAAITGYGSADKNQIQQMVKRLLLMKEIPRPDDAADALAMAICHLNMNRWNTMAKAHQSAERKPSV